MKRTTFFNLLLLLLVTIASLSAHIEESNKLETIKNHISHDKKTLIIFDIDNTILEADAHRAKDVWFSAMVEEGIKQGMPVLEAVKKTLPHYFAAHEKTKVIPTEANGPTFIKSLQDQNITIIALTARSAPMISHTFRQLKDIDIDFAPTAPSKEKLDFSLFEPAYFIDGIMFCANNDKETALEALLEKTNFKPEKIIYADDKEKYLKKVEHFAKTKDIEFVGIRYSTLDEKVAAFTLDDESKALLA